MYTLTNVGGKRSVIMYEYVVIFEIFTTISKFPTQSCMGNSQSI